MAVPVLATAAGNGGEPVVFDAWYPGNLTFAVGVTGVSSSAKTWGVANTSMSISDITETA
ncbi:MAG TPA: hypothetical protein VEG61_03770 [Candidatus Dormibacteraeota bacterium]|nr:hypothetical protein [Candidatus Dormibacteraeota bacterium]